MSWRWCDSKLRMMGIAENGTLNEERLRAAAAALLSLQYVTLWYRKIMRDWSCCVELQSQEPQDICLPWVKTNSHQDKNLAFGNEKMQVSMTTRTDKCQGKWWNSGNGSKGKDTHSLCKCHRLDLIKAERVYFSYTNWQQLIFLFQIYYRCLQNSIKGNTFKVIICRTKQVNKSLYRVIQMKRSWLLRGLVANERGN